MARFTIFGAKGFIGSRLVASLHAAGHDVGEIARDFPPAGGALGHVIYAIGLTADFRERPAETVRAHVCVLGDVLANYSFDSLLYLSSTRVYANAACTSENASLSAMPSKADDLYNLSKMTGEALCLSRPEPSVRVARLANVVGPADADVNFLPSVVSDCRRHGRVLLNLAPRSSKDYIGLADVCSLLPKICLGGRHRVYNVASGVNTTNQEIADHLKAWFNASVDFAPDARSVSFPPIDIKRLREEFGFVPMPFAAAFRELASR
jgi:nucleoside-diphosphate-sugar epimerase